MENKKHNEAYCQVVSAILVTFQFNGTGKIW